MIKKCTYKFFDGKIRPVESVQYELEKEAIVDDGVWSTFKFHIRSLPTQGLIKVKLRYYKLDCCDSFLPAQMKIFYKNCPELGACSRLPDIDAVTLQRVTNKIKLDIVKRYNGIWSTIKIKPWYDRFDVSFQKVHVIGQDEEKTYACPIITPVYSDEVVSALEKKYAEADINATNEALTNLRNRVYAEVGIKEAEKSLFKAADLEAENTKRTLQRLERLRQNTYYGLFPRIPETTTCAFDVKNKKDFEKALELWKAKAEKDTKEKEKKDMNTTLIIVPEGMNKDFVNRVKANFQSCNSTRLFVASMDIDYSSEYEPIKTKYDLFEKWIKAGKVDIVYFMLGFENDPDARAFEAFVRGFTEMSEHCRIDVRIAYQKDDIYDDANRLRTLYFDEADAKEDYERAANVLAKEVKKAVDIYSFDDEALEDIKNSKGRISDSDGLLMDKIMSMAFAEDEADKPVKKGGKK